MDNPIAFALTKPHATCQAHPTGQTTPTGTAVADDLGVVRFHAPPASWGSDVTLDCVGLDLSAQSVAVNLQDALAFQIPAVEATKPAPTVKAALTGDLTAYSSDEFIAMGYPPPPAPNSTAYAQWKRIVTTPRLVPQTEPVGVFDAAFTVEYWPNWGGTELQQPGVSYDTAWAYLIVPTLTDDHYGALTGFWTGIGGDNSVGVYPDNFVLIQAGVGLRTPVASNSYFAWVEYAPNGPVTIASVNAGDEIYVSCWPSDSDGNLSPGNAWGTYFMEDMTGTGWSAWLTEVGPWFNSQCTSLPGGACPPPSGETAEFIMEATNLEGFNVLADYGTATIYGGAQDTNGYYHDFSTDNTNVMYTQDNWGNFLQYAYTNYGPYGAFDETWFAFQQSL